MMSMNILIRNLFRLHSVNLLSRWNGGFHHLDLESRDGKIVGFDQTLSPCFIVLLQNAIYDNPNFYIEILGFYKVSTLNFING